MARAKAQFRSSAIAPIIMTLKAAAKPAFFVPAASSADMVGGAPSYVSGSHIWKGTKPILNPKPAINMATAKSARGVMSGPSFENPAMTCPMFVEPVIPYAIEIP